MAIPLLQAIDIVHVMEGDLPNARFWYGEAKRPFPKDFAVADEIAALKSQAPARFLPTLSRCGTLPGLPPAL